MEITNRQAKFWTFMLVMVLLFAVIVLGIDFAIKGAILEESTRLRGLLEDEERRRNGLKAASNGTAPYVPNHDSFSDDVLDVFPPRMETGGTSNGSTRPSQKARTRRSKPRTSDTDRGIQEGN